MLEKEGPVPAALGGGRSMQREAAAVREGAQPGGSGTPLPVAWVLAARQVSLNCS